jgi:glycosyltransferase involved in cell wall biosynthesis
MSKPRLSVILCTYNRADSLRATLICLSQLVIPRSIPWELIVVDNNSSDHTKDIVEGMKPMIPSLSYEFESRQGLSNARNHGLSVARGDIILFTDDDVCPDPDWAATLVDHIDRTGCDAAGGFVAPAWETPPPTWFTERFYGYLAVHTSDRNVETEVTDVQQAPYGANMAFRKSVFNKLGFFDSDLGRKGNVLAGGEEWDMFERMFNNGMRVMFFPDSRVHHRIESARLTKRYLYRWRYQDSRTIAENQGAPGKRRLLGIPLYFFPKLLRACLKSLASRLTQPADEAVYRRILCSHFMGTIVGLYRRKHS